MSNVTNWKHWYTDLSMIGRHYLVYSKDFMQVKRQYAICNSIVPQVYKELCNLCELKLNNQSATFDYNLLDSVDKDSIYLTCKKYGSLKDVST